MRVPMNKNQRSGKDDLQCRGNNQDNVLQLVQRSASQDGSRGEANGSHLLRGRSDDDYREGD